MKLNDEQQKIIYEKLLERDELIEKREANREKVKELHCAWKEETDSHAKRDFKQREQVGLRIIEYQTKRIKGLAMHRIADELGCDIYSVKYHQKSSGITL